MVLVSYVGVAMLQHGRENPRVGARGSERRLKDIILNELNEWVGLEALIAEVETEHGDPTELCASLARMNRARMNRNPTVFRNW